MSWNKVSKSECTGALVQAKQELGESPSVSQYRELDLQPTVYTMQNKFGSWNKAKRAAGLQACTNRVVSDDEISIAINLYAGGLSVREVADELEVQPQTIHYHLQNEGVTESISEALKGRDHSWGDKISQSLEGHEVSESTREKISETHTGKEPWNKGKTKKSHPDEIDYGRSGEAHHAWKGGISSELNRLRQTPEYKEWRKSVFERDNWTCQDCGQRGGELNAHHIKSFAENEDLRFDVDNGETLCKEHHIERHMTEERNE